MKVENFNWTELQIERAKWQKESFNYTPETSDFLAGLIEELGELAHAHLKMKQNIRTNENHFENKKDSVADIIIFSLGYLSSLNLYISSSDELIYNEEQHSKSFEQLKSVEIIQRISGIISSLPVRCDSILSEEVIRFSISKLMFYLQIYFSRNLEDLFEQRSSYQLFIENLLEVWNKVKQRNWKKFKENGLTN